MTATVQPLTEIQASVYRWICESIGRNGYSPTVREIQLAFGWRSPHGAACHVIALRRKGWITVQDNQARTIRPVEVTHA